MKIRLDQLILSRNLAPDLEKARAYIAAGLVRVNDQLADKAGTRFKDDCKVEVKNKTCPYVSRGGVKLAAGLDYFNIDPNGLICADIGASTGGFTDCLLQRGAAKVYAVDVGYGQLAWKLRQDSRVVVMERTNARNLKPGDIAEPLDLAVIDASFISLRLLLPPLPVFFEKKVAILALIKPQFEVAKEKVGKGGVIRDSELHAEVINEISQYSEAIGLHPVGVTTSPIHGPKGNKEFLIFLTSQP